MRNKMLILALVFSVAVNSAALVTIGYQWWASRLPERPQMALHRGTYRRELGLTEEQIRRFQDAQRQMIEDIDVMRRSLRSKRVEIVRLLGELEPDRAEIDVRLKEISTKQADLERLVVHNLLKLKDVLTPAQREKLLSIIYHRLIEGGRHMGPGRRGRLGRFEPSPVFPGR